jgi:hypothetical protein
LLFLSALEYESERDAKLVATSREILWAIKMSSKASCLAISHHERWLVALFGLVAALRVFLFAAAFPFFSNGDEDLHFDLIVRCANGKLPRTFDVLTEKTLDYIGVFASPEFLQTPENFPDGKFPAPLWKQPHQVAAPVIEATKDAWKNEINWEASQPPLYYVVAAIWWNAGKFFGLRGIQSLYWIRFLNALLMSILVWLGFTSARTVSPECPNLRIGVSLLLAFIPQDVFYVLSNDVLSPICFGIVFVCLLKWFSKPPKVTLGAITGLAIAAAYLTKFSNAPLLVVAIVAALAAVFLPPRRPTARPIAALLVITLCAGIPIAIWMLWCRANFGDITGSTTKMVILDWTRKPFRAWFDHPIFSFRGLWVFWSELLARFWRGELMWHNRELSLSFADNFYAITSLIFVSMTFVGIWLGPTRLKFELKALTFAGLAFLSAVAFLLMLSIMFDFGRCAFPSRARPFFTSGRLISGALVPFALLYTYGVLDLVRRVAPRFPAWIMLALIAALASSFEIAVKHSVFASEHNWFHL